MKDEGASPAEAGQASGLFRFFSSGRISFPKGLGPWWPRRPLPTLPPLVRILFAPTFLCPCSQESSWWPEFLSI